MPNFKECAMRGWMSPRLHESSKFGEKIRACRSAIARWKKENNKNANKEINRLKEEIDTLSHQPNYDSGLLNSLKKQLNAEYKREEEFWQQKSRILWLQAGDRNTKFFHGTTKNRRLRNRIHSLRDEHGKELYEDSEMGQLAHRYFTHLFTAGQASCDLNSWGPYASRVSVEQNEELLRPASMAEVERVVFEMHPGKSPGPDGMNGQFYHHFWPEVKSAVHKMVNDFLMEGVMEQHMNKTEICLIPKKEHASTLEDFRPISLCNNSYKIIAKIMTNRLQKIMPNLISENQAAFVKGRAIMDNIIINHEITHSLQTNQKVAKNFMALKTDMSKAFDRMEWHFLREILSIWGFSTKWIQLIMSCVTSVTYQVLINGSPYGDIRPTRGLRQGDPLSPYLFILGSEYLTFLLNKAEKEKDISGIKIAKNSPSITHLLFADDSLFYSKANIQEVQKVMGIINLYCNISGQKINYAKSSIIYGKTVPQEIRTQIQQATKIQNEGGTGKYLGMPEQCGRSKMDLLAYLKQRIQSKVKGWQNNFLSQGGKEILIKAVALALPTFSMSCFKLPKTLCKSITQVLSDFWWRNRAESKGIHWQAWNKLSRPKLEGGLGFRDLEEHNIALLGKQLWRILRNPDILLSKVLKAKYHQKETILHSKQGQQPSFAWRSLRTAIPMMKRGLRKNIGSGRETYFWKEPWLPTVPPRPPRCKAGLQIKQNEQVSEYIQQSTCYWKRQKVEEVVHENDLKLIWAIRPGRTGIRDAFSWDPTYNGEYSVRSGNRVQKDHSTDCCMVADCPNLSPIYKAIWRLSTVPKIKHFLRRAMTNSLPVSTNLWKRKLTTQKTCHLCHAAEETINHIFFGCDFSRLVWATSQVPSATSMGFNTSFYSNLASLLFYASPDPEEETKNQQFPWIMWRIWKIRNESAFTGSQPSVNYLLDKANQDKQEWMEAKADLSNNLTQQNQQSTHTVDTNRLNRRRFWTRPPQGILKCNVDASRSENADSFTGWLLRDSNGGVLRWGGKQLGPTPSPLIAEADGLLWAIRQTRQLGFKKVIFETDCQNLLKGLDKRNVWPCLDLHNQSISLLESDFELLEIRSVSRTANASADAIAQHAREFSSYTSIVSPYLPHSLLRCVNTDIRDSSSF